MHITFLNPPFLPRFSRESRSPAVTKSDCLYYPHWLATAAAAVWDIDGCEIDFIDACADNFTVNEIVKRIQKNKSSMVVLDTSTPSIYNDIKISNEIKKVIPEIITVLTGPHVTATINETFEYSKKNNLDLDYVCNGEFDNTLIEIVKCLKQKKKENIKNLKGLSYVTNEGKIIDNGKNNPIHNLDYNKFASQVYNKFLNIEKYFMPHTKYPHLSLISGRGCPYKCTFCQLPQVMHGHIYRTRSIKNVIDELEYIVTKMPKVKAIMFEDDTFTADQSRVIEICKEFKRRGLEKYNLELTCNARANVKRETLKEMYSIGFRMLCVGFEAGDQETLNKMKKGTKFEIINQFIEDAKHEKVKIHGCFMYGNKEETTETMKKTLDFSLSIDIDTAQYFPIMVSPGTADYDYFKRNNMLRTDDFSKWNDERGMHKSTISRINLSNEDIEKFCDYSRKKFYLRPKYIAKKIAESLTDKSHFKKNLRGFRKLATFIFNK